MPRKKSSAGKIILIICILVIGLPIVVPTALGLLFGGIWSSGRTCNISNSDLGGVVATAAVGILLGIHGFGQLFYSPVLGIGMLGVGCLLAGTWGSIYSIDRMGMYQTDSNDVPWACKSLSQTISEKER